MPCQLGSKMGSDRDSRALSQSNTSGQYVGWHRAVAHCVRDTVFATEVLGKPSVCIVTEENDRHFAKARRVADVLVANDQLDLRAATHKVFEFGDHLGVGC